ncbi:uncharacterized protein BP5553_01857 [Venustampulla echinocandica]|uniref:Uncharacterized protein n=1 Tax=Venustampulla echinocandica TaxID=2656787 RepID=A0A370U276_9HELO|nr:uncharacterized protein BP5553_01857 [Venustampulla echinocandica]RDL41878.1 hypothetical protein BP5553_01857 [Venustampulla echinocandica]
MDESLQSLHSRRVASDKYLSIIAAEMGFDEDCFVPEPSRHAVRTPHATTSRRRFDAVSRHVGLTPLDMDRVVHDASSATPHEYTSVEVVWASVGLGDVYPYDDAFDLTTGDSRGLSMLEDLADDMEEKWRQAKAKPPSPHTLLSEMGGSALEFDSDISLLMLPSPLLPLPNHGGGVWAPGPPRVSPYDDAFDPTTASKGVPMPERWRQAKANPKPLHALLAEMGGSSLALDSDIPPLKLPSPLVPLLRGGEDAQDSESDLPESAFTVSDYLTGKSKPVDKDLL